MTADAGTGRLVAGRYTVTGVLGRGGMGVVWDATDAVLGRPVALKEVVFPAHLTDEEREALRSRTAAASSCPGACPGSRRRAP